MPNHLFQEVIDISSSPEPYKAAVARATKGKGRSKTTGNKAGTSKAAGAKSRTKSQPRALIDLSNEPDDSPKPSRVRLAADDSPNAHLPNAHFVLDETNPKAHPSWASSDVDDDMMGFPSSPPPAPEPEPVIVDVDAMLASILEVLPDVLPSHALMLIHQLLPTYNEKTAHATLQYLFDKEYPKVQRDRGKRKREDDDEDVEGVLKKKGKLDYENTDRPYPPGPHYSVLAEEQLFEDFPLVPRAHVREVMKACSYFYAPTHLRLVLDSKLENPPYQIKARPTTTAKGKGKARFDAEFEAERDWLLLKLADDKLKADVELAEKLNEEEYEANGEGLECGCCFGDYPFDKMVQCAEGHLFCRECARRQAEERIGLRQTELLCMDQSDCKAPFPESEIARFLPEKTLSLYHRIKQGKEIEKAGLTGLEGCPFCDYACVIENDEEKLFRCENENCLVISCRKCKKQDHLPKSCKEVEDDTRLNARHTVEEAMTNALMRKCPKCQHPFVKEGGCNKMMCNQCRTLSCYICRQIITGYDHFNQLPGHMRHVAQDAVKDPNKCPLWDTNLDRQHADEVAAAARKAQGEILAARKDGEVQIQEKDLEVDLPKAPPTPPGPGPGQPGYNGGVLPPEFLRGLPGFQPMRPQLAPAHGFMAQHAFALQHAHAHGLGPLHVHQHHPLPLQQPPLQAMAAIVPDIAAGFPDVGGMGRAPFGAQLQIGAEMLRMRNDARRVPDAPQRPRREDNGVRAGGRRARGQ